MLRNNGRKRRRRRVRVSIGAHAAGGRSGRIKSFVHPFVHHLNPYFTVNSDEQEESGPVFLQVAWAGVQRNGKPFRFLFRYNFSPVVSASSAERRNQPHMCGPAGQVGRNPSAPLTIRFVLNREEFCFSSLHHDFPFDFSPWLREAVKEPC